MKALKISQTLSGKIYSYYMRILIFMTPGMLFAQSFKKGGRSLTDGVSIVLGIILLIAFPWGCVLVFQGANEKKRGEPGGFNSILAGLLIAAAPLIMLALYAAFGMSSVAVKPDFNFR